MYGIQRFILLIASLSMLLLGCQESRDPQTAAGALRLFGVALEEGDFALFKASLSEATGRHLEALLKTLREVEQEIKSFPSAEGRQWARDRALGENLSKVLPLTDSEALWRVLIGDRLEWAKKQSKGGVEQGVNMRRVISGNEESGEMTVLTRSDNQVSLRREGARWVITTFESSLQDMNQALRRSLKTLPLNRSEWIRREKLDLILPMR
jgi:hypothetical protein